MSAPPYHQGKRECSRRRRQMGGKMLSVKNVVSGLTALGRVDGIDNDPHDQFIFIQMDNLTHPHSHGWHPYLAHEWELRS